MSQTKPSGRKLSEVARHVVYPEGIVSTAWPLVAARCSEWGIEFDAWQSGLGQVMLGKRANGEYAATVGGITLSIPRQVAKTFLVSRTVFALCSLHAGLTVLWTAHRTRTATNTFDGLRGFARQAAVAPYIAVIRATNGEQEIRFTNGSRIMFGAREQGFGRGFDEVDIEVFDEAQILTEKALEDMVAATNQSRFPAGALLFFMGTPPRPVDPGFAFKQRRAEALSGESADAVYVECSADPDADPDDREQWRKANPSFPHRTPVRSMLRLRKNLPSVDAWRREALGIWDQEAAIAAAIPASKWACLSDPMVPDGRRVFGIKFSVDGSLVGLAGAVKPDDGPVVVAGLRLASTAEGMGWIVQFLEHRRDRVSQIVIDGKAGAAPLIEALHQAGFRARKGKPESSLVRVPSLADYVAAHAMFEAAVVGEELLHNESETLNDQVHTATKRKIGQNGGWGWAGITEADDVTLLDAVTLAHWGVVTTRRNAGRRQEVST